MENQAVKTLAHEWGEGNSRSGELLIQRLSPDIYTVSRRLLGDSQEAEDVTQETFMKLWKNLECWQEVEDLRSWLRRVAVNACFNILKKRSREKAVGALAARPDEQPAPSAIRPDLDPVADTIDSLNDTYRIPLMLRYLLGWSNDRAAEFLGLTSEALRVRIHRGLALLRSRLKGRIR